MGGMTALPQSGAAPALPQSGAAPAHPIAPLLPPVARTPSLVIDLDIVERNARRMADAVAARGLALRPHVKTHKSVRLAQMQLNAGAQGVTVGTLGEAEVMVAGGVDDLFIAYPLWVSGDKVERFRSLHDRARQLGVGVDSAQGAQRLAEAVNGSRRRLRVLIEVDPGNGRTGVRPVAVVGLARTAISAGLEVVGAFTHGGHAYRGADAVASAAADEVEVLAAAAEALRSAGIEPEVISAGSSPTALRDLVRPVTEVRPGTYLLGDRQQVALGASPADGVAIAIASTVISTTVPGQVVIDAGAKSLTKDLPAYLAGYGSLAAYPDGTIERVFDYHGGVVFPDGAARPELGEVVAVLPNHACPVVDLYDSFIASRAGSIVGRWPVDARGRSG
jgi:D-serine deaminase-like pyridoxal phosphate-dependent protein